MYPSRRVGCLGAKLSKDSKKLKKNASPPQILKKMFPLSIILDAPLYPSKLFFIQIQQHIIDKLSFSKVADILINLFAFQFQISNSV